ncbi:MAG TPA: site-specific DNA-methyltransferase, partial [Aquificae bacterium]|nr:site-specific DNA-methyltransferase [Aquificota bacterium]
VFNVLYSERGRKTKLKDILKELKKKGIVLDEETLERTFRVFERQNEVDYFINKNARGFLKEQFDLWFYQYIYSDETEFTERRVKQLKVLKEIAYKIIDFVGQFEDELVKIWQKPKFVLNSNYVITLDRIAKKEGGIEVIEKIVDRLIEQKREFKGELDRWRSIKENNRSYRERFEEVGEIGNQVVEWYLLDLVDEDFDPKGILIPTITGKNLNPEYKFLPVDTRYFKDLEVEILSLFDNLDEELDGWLIKSENWQALNTILPKFKEKVQTIYIDPPFNTGSNEFTMYINRFLDSAWITMMENRLRLAREFLKDTGSIFVRIDYHGNHYVRFLMDDIFGKENFRNEIIVKR